MALVPHGGDGAAVDQITKQSMSVRRHRNQVALFLLGRLENLIGRVAACEMDADLQAVGSK